MGALHRVFAGGRFHGLALASDRLAMSVDEKRESVLFAIRAEIERLMVATEQKEEAATRQLRDQLHGLAALPGMRRDLKDRPAPAKRRAASRGQDRPRPASSK